MYECFVKRLLDIVVSLIALPLVLVISLFVGVAIKIEDGGPIFYGGRRIGKYGKPFPMWKFRSMKVNAPDIRLADGSTYNGDDDPRVTKVGKFLRQTSIDELPQIFNVLLGDMSWVGVRPDPLDWLEKYNEHERVILKYRPGITGYNQAYCRNAADGEEKLRNDVYYSENASFWMDVKIVFKTVKTVLFRENIYKITE